jgi:hypothetical protein
MNTSRLFFILFFQPGIFIPPAVGQIKALDNFIDQERTHSKALNDIRSQINSTVFDNLLNMAERKPQVNLFQIVTEINYWNQ